MEVSNIKKQIVSKQLDSLYIFTGEELELMWTYIHKICEVSGKDLRYEDDYAAVVKKTRTISLVKTSCVYVLRDDTVLLKEEKLWDKLEGGVAGNILILLITELDKRTKFYKRFKDKIVEFTPMKEAALLKHIQSTVDLPETACKKLVELCEGNYGRILQEIDKITRFCAVTGISVSDCFHKFLEEGVIYEPPRDMIFELAKQFIHRNSVAVYQLAQECRENGESTLVVLSVLYNSVRQLLQVQTCTSQNVAEATGLTAWQVRNVAEARGRYKSSELVEILHIIHRLESGIKTGEVEEEFAIPYLFAYSL